MKGRLLIGTLVAVRAALVVGLFAGPAGHAHLYVNDVPLVRVYGPWHHLPGLKPGRHELCATVNDDHHNEHAVAGWSGRG